MITNNLLPGESETVRENQIFDDLSNFIQLFERSFSLIEVIAANAQRQLDHSPITQNIQLILKELQFLIQKYQEEEELRCLESKTFHRFVSRLMEIIALYKSKYKDCLFSISIHNFISILREIESEISRCWQQKLFSKIVNAIKNNIIKFCRNRQKSEEFSYNYQRPHRTEIYQRLSQKAKTVKNQQQCIQKTYVMSEKQRKDNKLEEQFNPVDKKDKIRTICQALTNIQTQFDLLDGLELDFCHFKSSSVLARTNPDQFQKCYLQKNVIISKIIAGYYDDFVLLQKRREQKQTKRNKQNKSKEVHSLDDTVKLQKECIKESIRIHKNKLQSCNLKIFKDKVSSFNKDNVINKQSYFMTPEQSKIPYKLKNVFIVLSKKRDCSRPLIKNDLIGSNLIKKKAVLQTASINQSYYNGLDYNMANEIDYLHSKLKIQYNGKLNNGFKMAECSQKDLRIDKQFQDQKIKIIDALSNEVKIIGYVNSTATLKNKIGDYGYKHHAHAKSNLILSSLNRNIALSLDNSSKAVSEQNRLMVRCNR